MSNENPGASGDYSPRPWMEAQPPVVRLKKPSYNSVDDEVRAMDLIANLTMDPEAIRNIRPMVGNVPFPARFGYVQRQPTIGDIFEIGPYTLMRDMATRQDGGQDGSMRNSMNTAF